MSGSSGTPPAGAPQIGDVVGDYTVEELLAAGATTTTYRARSAALGRPVRLKVLAAALFAAEPGARERAQADAVRAARLEHPGLAAVFSAGEHAGGLYVATALIAGTPLTDAVAEGGLPAARVASVITELAAALGSAHEADVIHLQLRPEVIVLSRWGTPVITDFGITRLSGSTGLATRMELVESLRYQAPELILGEPPGPAADVYGLASVALFCLAGEHPYPEPLSPTDLIQRRLAEPPSLDGIPGRAAAVLAQALAADPSGRTASVTDFAAELADALGAPADEGAMDLPPAPAPAPADAAPPAPTGGPTRVDRKREPPPPPPAPPPRPRGPVIVCAASVLCIGLIGFGVGRVGAPGAPEPPRTGAFAIRAQGAEAVPTLAATAPVRLSGALSLRVPGGPATVGTLTGGVPTDPVPAALATGEVPEPVPVRSGDRDLVRYAFSGATVYALPLPERTLVASCARSVPAARCAGLISTVDPGKARPLAVRPAPGPAKALAAALRTLEVDRGKAAIALNGKLEGRAAAAGEIRTAYQDAAGAIGESGLTGAERLQVPMRAAAMEYDDLANAIDRRSPSRYGTARVRARRAEGQLRDAVRGLRRSGFEVTR